MTEQPDIAPCLFCGGPCARGVYYAYCKSTACGYVSGDFETATEAIAAHNELASRVPREKLREVLRTAHDGALLPVRLRLRWVMDALGLDWREVVGINLEQSDD